jgi:hypothetical protein
MRFDDEQYVRLFTRDTPTWVMIGWEARAFLMALLRKVDRAGVLDLGGEGLEGLAVIVLLPLEIVKAGLPKCIDRGILALRDDKIIWLKFMEAQECAQTDKARKRAQRERDRALALHPENLPTNQKLVTAGHAESRPVTPRAVAQEGQERPADTSVATSNAGSVVPQQISPTAEVTTPDVTNRDQMSRPVTDGHSYLSYAELSCDVQSQTRGSSTTTPIVRDTEGKIIGTTRPLLPTIEPVGIPGREMLDAIGRGAGVPLSPSAAQTEQRLVQLCREMLLDIPTLELIGELAMEKWGGVSVFQLLGRNNDGRGLNWMADEARKELAQAQTQQRLAITLPKPRELSPVERLKADRAEFEASRKRETT